MWGCNFLFRPFYFGGLLSMIFWALLIVLFVVLIVRSGKKDDVEELSPEELLKYKYVNNKISEEVFIRKMNILKGEYEDLDN